MLKSVCAGTANAGRLKNGIVFLNLVVASKNLGIKQLIDCVEQLQ